MTDSLGFMDLKKRVGNNAEIYDAPHKRNVRFRGIVSINDNGIYCVGLFPLKDYDIIHFTEDPPEKSYFITGLFKPKTQKNENSVKNFR